MAGQNLSIDREFRYIVMWFNEWSELQKEDFIPVLVEYLSKNTSSSNGVYMNGLVNAVNNVGLANKPMSLFQCRIKLFREWSVKWPLDFKQKLQEKITELDPKVGEKIMNEMKTTHNNIHSNGNGSVESVEELQITEADIAETVSPTASSVNDDIVNAAIAIVNATEESIMSDNRLAAVLNNETSVDDDDDDDGDNDDTVNGRDNDNVEHVIEPAGQVLQEEHSVVMPAPTVLNNSAEVPLVA